VQCFQAPPSRARGLAPLLATPRSVVRGPPNSSSTRSQSHNTTTHQVSFLALVIVAAPVVAALYAYVVYPAILWCIATIRPRPIIAPGSEHWPLVTITVPVYNEVSRIRATLERLLVIDYPRDRLQLLVLSDASNDGTDDVVRDFAARGVELLRAPKRRGKTAGENAAAVVARGEIIVNIDATVAVPPGSLKKLIRAFADLTVGVASGRDLSVDAAGKHGIGPESGYTSYEMIVRDLETRAGSIVGASGCFYGIRKNIRTSPLPDGLSWDFASTLVARAQGFRSVSVRDAVCIVPRTAEIRSELRRKSRTMARGLSTLFHFRALMNPFRYRGFALMLISHKLFRWIPYLLMPASIFALGVLASQGGIAATVLLAVALGVGTGSIAIYYGSSIRFKPVALAGFVVAAITAGFLAWVEALRGARLATWDPTPRTPVVQS
jgi:glycosyltransferase involved in cell wall biosynthesis